MQIQADRLTALTTRIFAAAGCDAETAACVARHLVDSNLCGHDSHGVVRVARYLRIMGDGKVDPSGQPETVFDNGVVSVIDGHMGFGQVIMEAAMGLVAKNAAEKGLAMIAVRNTAHAGRLGEWAEVLAAQGLAALMFLRTTGSMAVPFGGSDRRLAINPLAMCVPVEGRHPILLDMTTTVVAEGKLAIARNKGLEVAPGTIVDKDGQPTTDPNDFYAGGALLPIAGHKGSGLNILTDILSGALTGEGCSNPENTTLVNSTLTIAIKPGVYMDASALGAEIKRYAGYVTSSPPKDPSGAVLMPGDVEFNTREKRQRDGIPLDDATWSQVLGAGREVGLSDGEMSELAGQSL